MCMFVVLLQPLLPCSKAAVSRRSAVASSGGKGGRANAYANCMPPFRYDGSECGGEVSADPDSEMKQLAKLCQ